MGYTDLQCGLQLASSLFLDGMIAIKKERSINTAVNAVLARSLSTVYTVDGGFDTQLEKLGVKIAEQGLGNLTDAELGVVRELGHRGSDEQRRFLKTAARRYTPPGFEEAVLAGVKVALTASLEVESFLRERLNEKIDTALAQAKAEAEAAPAPEAAPAVAAETAVAEFLGSSEPKTEK